MTRGRIRDSSSGDRPTRSLLRIYTTGHRSASTTRNETFRSSYLLSEGNTLTHPPTHFNSLTHPPVTLNIFPLTLNHCSYTVSIRSTATRHPRRSWGWVRSGPSIRRVLWAEVHCCVHGHVPCDPTRRDIQTDRSSVGKGRFGVEFTTEESARGGFYHQGARWTRSIVHQYWVVKHCGKRDTWPSDDKW